MQVREYHLHLFFKDQLQLHQDNLTLNVDLNIKIMKKLIVTLNIVTLISCNLSDRTIELPNDYLFEREGLYGNIVVRNHKAIIDHAALDYSQNQNYLMFVFDTVSIIPQKIDNTKLFFLVVDIKKDTLSKRMNFEEYRKFFNQTKIEKSLDLSTRSYPRL